MEGLTVLYFLPLILLGVACILPCILCCLMPQPACSECGGVQWYEASCEPLGHCKNETEPYARVRLYYARAFSWRGVLSVHTWVAVKEAGAAEWDSFHFTMWSGVEQHRGPPDCMWFNNVPVCAGEYRGDDAAAAIGRIREEALAWAEAGYCIWPGPNSNTFTQSLLRAAGGAVASKLVLPAHALGKDYLKGCFHCAGCTPSGTGVQADALGGCGLLGCTIGCAEGVRFQYLTAEWGLSLWPRLTLHCPGLGPVRLCGCLRPDDDAEEARCIDPIAPLLIRAERT